MDGGFVAWVSARSGSLPMTFSGSATMSPCFPCSMSISNLHYSSQSSCAHCNRTISKSHEICILKKSKGIQTFSSNHWLHIQKEEAEFERKHDEIVPWWHLMMKQKCCISALCNISVGRNRFSFPLYWSHQRHTDGTTERPFTSDLKTSSPSVAFNNT